MVRKALIIAPTAGLPGAGAFTVSQWWHNPRVIYQTQYETQSQIVGQALSARFIIVALTALALFWGTSPLVFRLCSRKRWKFPESTEESGS